MAKKVSVAENTMDNVYNDALGTRFYRPGPPREFISTGSSLLDWNLGGYGIPTGRIHEVRGVYGSAKSTLILQIIREAQRKGGQGHFVDIENGYEQTLAVKLGVDISPEKLYVSTPLCLEDAEALTEGIIAARENADTPTVIVWDTLAMAGIKKFVDEDVGEKQAMCQVPRNLSLWFMRKWVPQLKSSKCVLILVNQYRDKLDMYSKNTNGPGGHAMRHQCSTRMLLTLGEPILDHDKNQIGHMITAHIDKNKLTGRNQDVPLCVLFDKGVDDFETLLHFIYEEKNKKEWNIKTGRLEYGGKSWYRFQLREYLQDSPSEVAEFKAWCYSVWRGEVGPTAQGIASTED